jgi:signal transduction histidine kinase
VLNRVLRHNLRNDMTIIGGCAEALQERCSGSDADLAERILDTSNGLVQLTETARKLEQNLDEPSALEPTDVVALVTASVRKIREEYPDATVSVDAPDVATARIAPRLETAMTELLDNAARHAGEAPSIDVGVSVRDERVVVRVADDGPGLPENERAVLVSGEETPLVHGSGLGLWLVHWIVGSCDGSLRVDDDADGAVIEILLRQSGA